ncbi:hypothetical protein ACJA88_005741 [Fusarium oxysporum]
MPVVTHDVVPDGDIYIVLKNPNAKWTAPLFKLRKHATDKASYIRDKCSMDLPNLFRLGLEPYEYRIRVSSQHLITACPKFKKMLQSPWKESAPVNATSPSESSDQVPCIPAIREISTSGWNVHALVQVLNIIHGRNKEVTRGDTTLRFIADMTVIVNYYECVEAASLAADLWRERVDVPKKYGKESIVLLFISWVFSWDAMFSSMAQLVMEHGEGLEHVETNNLPIATILEKLDKKRQWSFPVVFNRLNHLRGELLQGRMGCNRKCRDMLVGRLGAAKNDMNKKFGNWDRKHKGISVGLVMSTLDNYASPKWRDPDEKGRAHSRDCSIKNLMQPTFN